MMMDQNTKRSARYRREGVQEKQSEKTCDFPGNAELMIIWLQTSGSKQLTLMVSNLSKKSHLRHSLPISVLFVLFNT